MVLVIKEDGQGRETLHSVQRITLLHRGYRVDLQDPKASGITAKLQRDAVGYWGCGSSQGQREDTSPEDPGEVTELWIRPGFPSCLLTYLEVQATELSLGKPQFPLEDGDQHRAMFTIRSHCC